MRRSVRKKPPCPFCNDTRFDGAGGDPCTCNVDDSWGLLVVIVMICLAAWLV